MNLCITLRKAILFIMLPLLCSDIISISVAAADGYPPDYSHNQSMGLINIPTANVLKHREYRVSLNTPEFSVGLFNFFELGLMAISSGSSLYLGNRLTIKLIEEEGYYPAIAIGGESVVRGDQISYADPYNSLFFVASKGLDQFGIFHLGIGNGRYIGTGPASGNLNGIFMGIEKSFNAGRLHETTIKLEEDGKNINCGVKYCPLVGLYIVLTFSQPDNYFYSHPAPNNNINTSIGLIWEGMLPPERRVAE